MDKPPALGEKLFIFRDIEGEQNTEAIKILRALEEKLNQYDWFIAVGPIGSTVRGYSVDDSDIDLKIIYDRTKIKLEEVLKRTGKCLEEVEQEHNLIKDKLRCSVESGIDIHKIKNGLTAYNLTTEHLDTLRNLKELSGLLVGHNIEEMRNQIRELLNSLSPERRTTILNQLLGFCMLDEKTSEKKIRARTGMTIEEISRFWEERKKLWKRRINTLWS